MYATSLAAAASDATRARRSPGGRSNTPATATCTGVRAAPAKGGRRELAATREPRHAPTAASWLGCIMDAVVPRDMGRSDTTSSVAGGSGAVRCKGGGAAAMRASALSPHPAFTSSLAVAAHLSRSTWSDLRATSLRSEAVAAMRAMASATGPRLTCVVGGGWAGARLDCTGLHTAPLWSVPRAIKSRTR